jgi:hypothetical protein
MSKFKKGDRVRNIQPDDENAFSDRYKFGDTGTVYRWHNKSYPFVIWDNGVQDVQHKRFLELISEEPVVDPPEANSALDAYNAFKKERLDDIASNDPKSLGKGLLEALSVPPGKTVRKWLNELPVEIRDRAIRNAENYIPFMLDDKAGSFDNSLLNAFLWRDTPEGIEFWSCWDTWLQDPSLPKPTIQPADGSFMVTHADASTQARQFVEDALRRIEEGYGVECNGILDALKEGGEDHSGDVNEKIERMRFEAAAMYMAALASQLGSLAHKAERSVVAADALIAEIQKPKP